MENTDSTKANSVPNNDTEISNIDNTASSTSPNNNSFLFKHINKSIFTPKSSRNPFFYKRIQQKSDSDQKNKTADSVNIKIVDKLKEKEVSKTLGKWLNLQKVIKEELSLEDVMISKQINDCVELKKKFKEYYEIKLKIRKEFNIIKNVDIINKKANIIKELKISDDMERTLLDVSEPIKNLLFLLRNNYDYIAKLVSLIDDNDDPDKVESLVELFCNQFYDNILIPIENQEELLLLIFKLLEDEIIPMNSASLDEFLSDESFIGKFISSYIKRQDFKLFLNNLLNPLIASIENNDSDCLDMSLNDIKNDLNKADKVKEGKEKSYNALSGNLSLNSSMLSGSGSKSRGGVYVDVIDDINDLFKNIPKSTIQFKINPDLDEKKEKEEKKEKNDNIKKGKTFDYSSKSVGDKLNDEYTEDLNKEKIIEKIINEKNIDTKEMYLHQLEFMNNDSEIYTNKGIMQLLNEMFQSQPEIRKKVVEQFKQNFLFIKAKIDFLIQELINKINTIPYSLRCICKVVYFLMLAKFPLLPKFLRNSFIGKFLFDKCIFPILSLETNNSLDNKIFSITTKKCLNVIINVLSNANRCCLYTTNSDTEKTIFNYYLLEIIPILNKFYEKLIDVELPHSIEQLLSQINNKIENNTKIFRFKRKKIPNAHKRNSTDKSQALQNSKTSDKNDNKTEIKNEISYDYFKENSDEIFRLQSICFSLSDVLFIVELVDRNQKIFTGPKQGFFTKTIERIKCDDYKLTEQIKLNQNAVNFYVIFKEEKNSLLEKLINDKKQSVLSFLSGVYSPEEICIRIKFCIKTLLKKLSLISIKNSAYFNKAVTTNNFFSALRYTLNEIGENTEIYEPIPLKWYSQYIYDNRNKIDITYINNDYAKLYDELFSEESNKLTELKNISSILITRDGINLNYAQDILNNIGYYLDDIIEKKKISKIERFIETEKMNLCINILGSEYNTSSQSEDLSDKDRPAKIIIREDFECEINNQFHKVGNDSTNHNKNIKPLCHATYIRDLINKFSLKNWEKEKEGKNKTMLTPRSIVGEEIRKGDRKYGVYKTMKMLMDIIKEKIKNPYYNENLFNDISDYSEIMEIIEDHILRQIYKYVFPTKRLEFDIKFYSRTASLKWVTPEQLEMKKIPLKQIEFAKMCIKKMDDAKSVTDKLNCIRDAHASLNNAIKYSYGKNSEAGQDDLTPIFQYIIIQAQPKKIYSNIYYIKCFLDESELSGSKGFLVVQIESATSYIEKLGYKDLKISKEEFEANIEKYSLSRCKF